MLGNRCQGYAKHPCFDYSNNFLYTSPMGKERPIIPMAEIMHDLLAHAERSKRLTGEMQKRPKCYADLAINLRFREFTTSDIRKIAEKGLEVTRAAAANSRLRRSASGPTEEMREEYLLSESRLLASIHDHNFLNPVLQIADVTHRDAALDNLLWDVRFFNRRVTRKILEKIENVSLRNSDLSTVVAQEEFLKGHYTEALKYTKKAVETHKGKRSYELISETVVNCVSLLARLSHISAIASEVTPVVNMLGRMLVEAAGGKVNNSDDTSVLGAWINFLFDLKDVYQEYDDTRGDGDTVIRQIVAAARLSPLTEPLYGYVASSVGTFTQIMGEAIGKPDPFSKPKEIFIPGSTLNNLFKGEHESYYSEMNFILKLAEGIS